MSDIFNSVRFLNESSNQSPIFDACKAFEDFINKGISVNNRKIFINRDDEKNVKYKYKAYKNHIMKHSYIEYYLSFEINDKDDVKYLYDLTVKIQNHIKAFFNSINGTNKTNGNYIECTSDKFPKVKFRYSIDNAHMHISIYK